MAEENRITKEDEERFASIRKIIDRLEELELPKRVIKDLREWLEEEKRRCSSGH